MVRAEKLALAALNGDALELRAHVQDLLRENPDLSRTSLPQSADPIVLAVAAALVELLALRSNQPPPSWTRRFTAVPNPIYLVKAAHTMKRLRELCEAESPEPLRSRNIFAPPTFLEFA